MEKNFIKLYKPLCFIRVEKKIGNMIETEILLTPLENKKSIINDANNTHLNLIMIEGKAVSRFDIKEIDDYNPEESDIKMYIATRSPAERRALLNRDRVKFSKVGKGIETVREAEAWLE